MPRRSSIAIEPWSWASSTSWILSTLWTLYQGHSHFKAGGKHQFSRHQNSRPNSSTNSPWISWWILPKRRRGQRCLHSSDKKTGSLTPSHVHLKVIRLRLPLNLTKESRFVEEPRYSRVRSENTSHLRRQVMKWLHSPLSWSFRRSRQRQKMTHLLGKQWEQESNCNCMS